MYISLTHLLHFDVFARKVCIYIDRERERERDPEGMYVSSSVKHKGIDMQISTHMTSIPPYRLLPQHLTYCPKANGDVNVITDILNRGFA